MSHRPIEQKQRKRVARAFRKAEMHHVHLIDLLDWMVRTDKARTKRQARQMVADDRVLLDGTPIKSWAVPVAAVANLSIAPEVEDGP